MDANKTPKSQRLYTCQIVDPQKSTVPAIAAQIKVEVDQGQFIFHLDETELGLIQQAQAGDYRLVIPTGLLADLRRHALLDFAVLEKPQGSIQTRSRNFLQSGLTFLTHYIDFHYYYARPLEEWQIQPNPRRYGRHALRTVVSLDGDIIHQVCAQYLKHPYAAEIASAHYWLIQQLTRALYRTTLQYLDAISWGAALLPAAIALASNPMDWLNWLLTLLLGAVSRYLKAFLHQQFLILLSWLSRWAWSYLFSPHRWLQWLGKQMVGRILP